MTNSASFEAMRKNPKRYFMQPEDVVAAHYLSESQKLEILKAWQNREVKNPENTGNEGEVSEAALMDKMARFSPPD